MSVQVSSEAFVLSWAFMATFSALMATFSDLSRAISAWRRTISRRFCRLSMHAIAAVLGLTVVRAVVVRSYEPATVFLLLGLKAALEVLMLAVCAIKTVSMKSA